MELKLDIPFQQLLDLVKNLPVREKGILKEELDKNSKPEIDREEFRKLLLQAPTFSNKQLKAIKQARKQINKWRTV